MMPFRRHDRYILKAFWGTFAAVLLFFTLIIVVLDVSSRLAKLSRYWGPIAEEGGDPLLLIVQFYVTLVPFIWLRVLPFCVPIAAAFCLARLIRHNELTPLLTGGVSLRRVVGPILMSAFIIAGLVFVVEETLVSRLSRKHMEAGRTLGKAEPDRMSKVPHFHDPGENEPFVDADASGMWEEGEAFDDRNGNGRWDPGGGRLSVAAFMPIRQRLEGVFITFRDAQGAPAVLYRYPVLDWDAARGAWIATRGGQRIPIRADSSDSPGMRRLPLPAGDPAPLSAPLALIEISMTVKRSMGLSLAEISALAEANPDNPRLVVLKHELFTLPLSTVVLLLLALPFCVRAGRLRRSPIPGMLGIMGVGGLFLAATFLTSGMAGAGDFNPVVLAWLPTVVFGSLGVALYVGLDG